ncbi:hypothetical protein B0H19DRAFT_1145704 [Mycena capillaripes]|nr:hypothetical protein B0H19DRAFT_1175861 [Mycena capillaripes]KAJ6559735.1 hypothetical protein B0H19DRAFT_1145704 [Mycena capillaripes]
MGLQDNILRPQMITLGILNPPHPTPDSASSFFKSVQRVPQTPPEHLKFSSPQDASSLQALHLPAPSPAAKTAICMPWILGL